MTTKIQWCDETWNPVMGCVPITPGCDNCYARSMIRRFAGKNGWPKSAAGPEFFEKRLKQPLQWRKARRIFICSMADLFQPGVPFEYKDRVLNVIKQTPQHEYLILTKRAMRMQNYLLTFPPPSNLHLGVTVENQETADWRIPPLLTIPATVRFISVEPMLEDICLDKFEGIDWVICGGENGPGARPMHPDWVRRLRDQCVERKIPFFFKSWGAWLCVYDRDVDDPEWRHCPPKSKGRYMNLAGGAGFHGDRVCFFKKRRQPPLIAGDLFEQFPTVHPSQRT